MADCDRVTFLAKLLVYFLVFSRVPLLIPHMVAVEAILQSVATALISFDSVAV